MRRYGRQGHLTSRLERIAVARPIVERIRPQMRQLATRLSDSERARIVEERREGATLPLLMKKYSLSSYSLRLVFAEGGIAPIRTSLSPSQIERIRGLVEADCSVMEIAHSVGAPQSTVRLVVAYLRHSRYRP